MAFDTPIIPGANPRLSTEHIAARGDGIRLIGQQCKACGKTLFPRTGICPDCRSEDLQDVELPDEGVLYSWSVVHVAPKPWVTPYVIGYVDLPSNVRVFSHISGDSERLKVGMTVKLEAVPPVAPDAKAPPFLFSPVRQG